MTVNRLQSPELDLGAKRTVLWLTRKPEGDYSVEPKVRVKYLGMANEELSGYVVGVYKDRRTATIEFQHAEYTLCCPVTLGELVKLNGPLSLRSKAEADAPAESQRGYLEAAVIIALTATAIWFITHIGKQGDRLPPEPKTPYRKKADTPQRLVTPERPFGMPKDIEKRYR